MREGRGNVRTALLSYDSQTEPASLLRGLEATLALCRHGRGDCDFVRRRGAGGGGGRGEGTGEEWGEGRGLKRHQ